MRRRNTLIENIHSNFGKITVFKPLTPNKESEQQQHEKTEYKEKIIKPVENNLQSASYLTNSTEDFYGIEEDEQILNKNKKEYNKQTGTEFIDEAFDLNYNTQNIQSTKSITKSDIENLNDLNYIDDAMLKNGKDTEAKRQSNKNITVNEIKNDENLNYIDKVYFKNETNDFNTQTFDDQSIGSLKSFRTTKLVKKEKSTETIEFDDKVIVNENENENKVKAIQSENSNNQLPIEKNKNSIHKILQSEVPQWYKMTIDEAARLLIKHICYFNVEHGVLAIDKPYGLPSIGGPGVHLSVAKIMPRLKELLKINYELYMMHRLDENTTGVMLFATNKESELKIRNLFTERKIIKQYLAITKFVPKDKEGEINIPLIERQVNGLNKIFLSPNYTEETSLILDKPNRDNTNRKNAITLYRVLDSYKKSALIECQPLTGLKHQIRVHLSFGLGCPILGDHKYSHHLKLEPQKLPEEMLKALKITQTKVRYVPMHLHSYRIILPEYFNNQNIFITAKLPLHFKNNLNRLKLLLK